MEGEEVDDSESESESEPEVTGANASPAPTTIGQPLVLNHTYVDPPPFMDVLSFRSSTLLPVSRKEINALEAKRKKENGIGRGNCVTALEEDTTRLDALLSSVHLLLEPIQLPDLSHTGLFDPATSLLRPVAPTSGVTKPEKEPPMKMKLTKVDRSDEVKLFYPTGAKNSNMRDYIKETIQKHFSTADLEQVPNDHTLGASASAPILHTPGEKLELAGRHRSTSPSKTRKFKKKAKVNAIKSPVKASLTTGALLNPQLTRQAKEIVAAVRANSSKINELISK
ncbi:unnamed protein product [Phytophthora fragariaefolia]|uniref:Unnamed protein product n=1 Tax=Phytophthora fragariaefolia TaxID=1490495 RepID=A0A9W6XSI0_9STRA|nr:unnamed protein product [Phytophthora fragariaefolia]